jgi:hypothetical protein
MAGDSKASKIKVSTSIAADNMCCINVCMG